jgi:hypothetical protein
MSALVTLCYLGGCASDSPPNKGSSEGQTIETESGANVVLEGQPLEKMTEVGRRSDDRVGSALEKR